MSNYKENQYEIKKLYVLLLFVIIFNNIFKIIIKARHFKYIDYNDCYINKFFTLKNKPEYLNDTLIIKEKIKIFQLFSESVGRHISSIDTIFLASNCNFGNCLVVLNKILFYCEIIGCKTIILDENIFWFIKNQIIIRKYNISIKIGSELKYNKSNVLYYNSMSLFHSFYYIKPKIKINLIRNEIIRNLIKINVDEDDLFIHIRSGGIFIYPHYPYAQPPFCFYRKILNNHKFKNVYLIAENKNNPVIEKILNEYTNVIFKENSIKDDISYLINAYNIVASISSFLVTIVQLNYNLKTLYDYNIYKLSEKILTYHYDLYQFPYNNFIIINKRN